MRFHIGQPHPLLVLLHVVLPHAAASLVWSRALPLAVMKFTAAFFPRRVLRKIVVLVSM